MPRPVRPRLARGSLNREVILEAAVRALGRPGAPRVTMRALADELGADPTAVYRHFRGKDDLLGALTDRLLEPLDASASGAGWREQLAGLADTLHAVLARSPGAVAVLAESPFTPTSVRAVEVHVAALVADGMAPALAAASCQAVVLYVVGHAAGAAADPDGFWSGLLDAVVPAAELPTLHATASAWRAPPDEQFRSGLELLLDGVGVRRGAG